MTEEETNEKVKEAIKNLVVKGFITTIITEDDYEKKGLTKEGLKLEGDK